MALVTEHRLAGIFFALFFGLGVPGFLLGPFIFSGVSLALASTVVVTASAIVGLLGAWLAVIFVFADEPFISKISEANVGELAVPFLPYVLWRGTTSALKRVRAK